MTINLKVQQGSIVLPEELHLPDGTEVQLVVVALPGQQDRSHRFGFAKGKFRLPMTLMSHSKTSPPTPDGTLA